MEQELKLKKVDISKAKDGNAYFYIVSRGPDKHKRHGVYLKDNGNMYRVDESNHMTLHYVMSAENADQAAYEFYELGEFAFN